MSLWSKLKGRKKEATEPEAFLLELEQEIVVNTKSAIKRMGKRPRHFEPSFDFGGQFHDRFAALALRNLSLTKNRQLLSYADLPPLGIVTDREAPTFGQALSVEAAEKDVVFLRLKDGPSDVLASIEALYELATDPSALLIVQGNDSSANIFIRRDHLLTLKDTLKADLPLEDAVLKIHAHHDEQKGMDSEFRGVLSPSSYLLKFSRKKRSSKRGEAP